MSPHVTNMSPGQRAERYFANRMLELERAGLKTDEEFERYMRTFDRWARARELLNAPVAPITRKELQRRFAESDSEA